MVCCWKISSTSQQMIAASSYKLLICFFTYKSVDIQEFKASILRKEERISFLTNDLSLCAWNFSKFLAWEQVTVIQITEWINDFLLSLSTVSLLYNSIEISSGLSLCWFYCRDTNSFQWNFFNWRWRFKRATVPVS